MELAPIDPSFYRELFSWRKDPMAMKYNPFAPCTFDGFSERMSSCSSALNPLYDGKDRSWGVIEQKNLVATTSLKMINKMMKTAEIGYQVNPKFRGQGIGKRAVSLLVRMVFLETDLRKLTAVIADENLPSCKLVERLGFQQEGLLRKHFLIQGREVDERVYGLLREDVLRASSC